MPFKLKGYKVFIASPTGLEEERKDWEKSLREDNAGSYVHTEWDSVRSNWGFK